jgi:hypothetical protein
MTISIEIDVLNAERIVHKMNNAKEARYIVLRPRVSENDDHHNGKIDMLSMYRATDIFVTVGVALS